MAYSQNNSSNAINICFSINNEYAQHCCCTIASILCNYSEAVPINFYIFIKDLSDKNKKYISKIADTKCSSIEFIHINEQDFINLPVKKYSHFSIENYFRIKAPSLLPEVDKVLYLDSDTIVLSDINELWQTDIDDYYLAVCEDSISHSEKKRLGKYIKFDDNYKYYNSGILLINSKKWREDNIENQLYKYAKEYYDLIYIVDQDVLNGVLHKNIKYLDTAWNVQINFESKTYEEADYDKAKIIHFVGNKKPWNFFGHSVYAKKYFKYLLKTPWRLEYSSLPIKLALQELYIPIVEFIKEIKCHLLIKKIGKQKNIVFWEANKLLKKILRSKKISEYNIVGIADTVKSEDEFFSQRYKLLYPDDIKNSEADYVIITTINNPRITEYVEDLILNNNLTCKVIQL